MTIEQLIDDVIGREGGYVDHPADRGGTDQMGRERSGGARRGLERRNAQSAARLRRSGLPTQLLDATRV